MLCPTVRESLHFQVIDLDRRGKDLRLGCPQQSKRYPESRLMFSNTAHAIDLAGNRSPRKPNWLLLRYSSPIFGILDHSGMDRTWDRAEQIAGGQWCALGATALRIGVAIQF